MLDHLNPTHIMSIFHRICDFGGRLSGTKSEADALAYVRHFLDALPGGDLRLHDVDYDGWSSSECWIDIKGCCHEVFALPRGGSLPSNGVSLQVIDAGRGTIEELDALGPALAGKAVVVTHEFMFAADHVHRMKKIDCAERHGAAAFVISNPDPATGRVSGGIRGSLAGFGVSHATRMSLRQAADTDEHVHFHLDSKIEKTRTQTIDWCIAGSDPAFVEQEIIISAHLDGHESSENAMDNASGVAVALAIERELSDLDAIPCTVRALIFSAEEFGLCGSETYVAALPPR
ncbi:MAG: M28 family peptidase [Amylibacter sp.]